MAIVKFKNYVATVARYEENEDGTITKKTEDLILKGRRFSDASVWKQIPRDCKLISHGYREEAYEVDDAALLGFCSVNGKRIEPSSDTDNNATA